MVSTSEQIVFSGPCALVAYIDDETDRLAREIAKRLDPAAKYFAGHHIPHFILAHGHAHGLLHREAEHMLKGVAQILDPSLELQVGARLHTLCGCPEWMLVHSEALMLSSFRAAHVCDRYGVSLQAHLAHGIKIGSGIDPSLSQAESVPCGPLSIVTIGLVERGADWKIIRPIAKAVVGDD